MYASLACCWLQRFLVSVCACVCVGRLGSAGWVYALKINVYVLHDQMALLWWTITLDNIIFVSWEVFAACHETFLWVTYTLIKSNSVSFPSFFFFCSMLENELRHSACSNWKMYSPRRHCSPFVCLCVGLCLCMPLCRQWGTDAERCVLIFATRWAPLAVTLGCSDVTHVSLTNIQLRNSCAGWSKWHI